MIDHRLLIAYELEDEAYAFSSRCTVASEFILFCSAVQWMCRKFSEGDAYGNLVEGVSTISVRTCWLARRAVQEYAMDRIRAVTLLRRL